MIRLLGSLLCVAGIVFCLFVVLAKWAGLDINLLP